MAKMLSNKLREYKNNGFTLIPGFFIEDEILDLTNHVNKFLKRKAINLKGKNVNFANKKIVNTAHDVDKFDLYFKNFSKKKKILEIAKFFINSEIEFRKCEIFAKPSKVGMSSPFHQDNFYWGVENDNALTIWVALDDANKKNGGLTYYKASHKYGVVDHEDSYAPGSSQKIKDEILEKYSNLEIVTPELNRGDILIHHSLTFHGSSENKSNRDRKGFTMQFKDKNAKYDTKHLKYYNSRLNEQIRLRQKKSIFG